MKLSAMSIKRRSNPVVTGPVMTGINSSCLPTIEELEAIIRDEKLLEGLKV